MDSPITSGGPQYYSFIFSPILFSLYLTSLGKGDKQSPHLRHGETEKNRRFFPNHKGGQKPN